MLRKNRSENQYKHGARELTKLKEAREHVNCGSDDRMGSAENSNAEGIEIVKIVQEL